MASLQQTFSGRVWKVGDSVDTNQLAGGGIQGADAKETLRINCLRGLRPDFTENVSAGDIVVAGTNFGCGSSRQTAVEALQLCGVAAVLAESVARIHRRNAIALALPIFALPGITGMVEDGDTLEVDYPHRAARNTTNGKSLELVSLPASVEEIYEAGGILEVIRVRLAAAGITPESEHAKSMSGA